jgi:hypothetical protein
MITKLISIFLVSAICYCQAQEDRPLPPLIASDAIKNELREDVVFQKRTLDPIIIDVRREENKVSLVAKNISFYPYTLRAF